MPLQRPKNKENLVEYHSVADNFQSTNSLMGTKSTAVGSLEFTTNFNNSCLNLTKSKLENSYSNYNTANPTQRETKRSNGSITAGNTSKSKPKKKAKLSHHSKSPCLNSSNSVSLSHLFMPAVTTTAATATLTVAQVNDSNSSVK